MKWILFAHLSIAIATIFITEVSHSPVTFAQEPVFAISKCVEVPSTVVGVSARRRGRPWIARQILPKL